MSSKDEAIIPKRPRERHGPKKPREQHGRSAGNVDDQEDLVALRTGRFRPTRLEDVYGCLKRDGRPLTVAAMDKAVRREARKHR
jgi:hypothetical protein